MKFTYIKYSGNSLERPPFLTTIPSSQTMPLTLLRNKITSLGRPPLIPHHIALPRRVGTKDSFYCMSMGTELIHSIWLYNGVSFGQPPLHETENCWNEGVTQSSIKCRKIHPFLTRKSGQKYKSIRPMNTVFRYYQCWHWYR